MFVEHEVDAMIRSKLKVLQILGASLIMGVVMFAVIASVVGGQAGGAPNGGAGQGRVPLDMLRYITGAVLLGGLVGAVVFGAIMKKRVAELPHAFNDAADGGDLQQQLFGRFFISTIVAFALLEAPALLGAIVVLLGGNTMDLILVALPVVGMLALFPTAGKWRRLVRAAHGEATVHLSRQ